jgi:hypothetical protein
LTSNKQAQTTAGALRVSVAALCRSVKAANRAFEAILQAGIRPASVSVLARGVEVDRHLIADAEMNANHLASPGKESIHLSALARKLSAERRLLLEGCWAAGPLFQAHASKSGGHGVCALTETLASGGISKEAAVELEAELEKRGGVWLGVSGEELETTPLDRALRAIDGVTVVPALKRRDA